MAEEDVCASSEGNQQQVTPSNLGGAKKPNNGGTISEADTDDSWSVIYSDDSNSVNDFESKLTDSTGNDPDEDSSRQEQQDNDISLTRSELKRNRETGGSISTLKDSKQWNGSLSIPKLAIKSDSAPAPEAQQVSEETPKIAQRGEFDTEPDSLSEFEENIRRIEASAVKLKKYLFEKYALWDGYLVTARDKVPYLPSIPYVKNMGLREVIGVCILLLACTFVGPQNSEDPTWDSLNPQRHENAFKSTTETPLSLGNNYLLCTNTRSVAIVGRDHSGWGIGQISYFGDFTKEEIAVFNTELKKFDKILLVEDIKTSPALGELQKFATQFCHKEMEYFTEKKDIGHLGKVVIFSDDRVMDPASKAIWESGPSITQRQIEEFVGYSKPDHVVKLSSENIVDSGKENLQSLLRFTKIHTDRLMKQVDENVRDLIPLVDERAKVLVQHWKNDVVPILEARSNQASALTRKFGQDLALKTEQLKNETVRFYNNEGKDIARSVYDTVYKLTDRSARGAHQITQNSLQVLRSEGPKLLSRSAEYIGRVQSNARQGADKLLQRYKDLWKREGSGVGLWKRDGRDFKVAARAAVKKSTRKLKKSARRGGGW